MKRKVNLVGSSTLTVSLPTDWTKKNSINKGDLLEVNEKENGALEIDLKEQKPHVSKARISAKGNSLYIQPLLASKYKAGYDQLEIQYFSQEEKSLIQIQPETDCIGYDIIDSSKDTIKIEIIMEPDKEEFEKVFKKIFLTLEVIIDELITYSANKDYSGVKNCILRHNNINKYSNICRRIINKNLKGFKDAVFFYYAIESLEQTADMYLHISKEIFNHKLMISKSLIEAIKESKEFLIEMKKLFFDYSDDKMRDFYKKKIYFDGKLDANLKFKKEELLVFCAVKFAIQRIFDFNGIIMTMQKP